MSKWYVVQVFSSQEKKIKKILEEQSEKVGVKDRIEEVFVPIENVSEVKNGKTKIVEKRLWPGYLFLKMVLDDESWTFVKNTAGVIGFVGGDSPTALTEKEVEEILSDLQGKQEVVTQRHKFEPGHTVKIIDGVFVNFMGTVTEVFHDKGRLSVMVSIFGRDTRVDDLEFSQVEEVTSESSN